MQYPLFSQEPYRTFRKTVRDFVVEEIEPHVDQWERQEHFPNELLKLMAGKNLIGVSLPKDKGGQGLSFWHEVILAEELAKSKLVGWAMSYLAHTNMALPLLVKLASPKQQADILMPAVKGEFYLSLAATEFQNGSDLVSTKTEAVLQGDKFLVSGEKKYITNGSVAKYLITLVRTKSDKNIWSLGLLLVPTDVDKIGITKLKTSGLKTSDTAEIKFLQCEIPKDYILGGSQRGFYYLLNGLMRERLMGAVALNTLAEQVLEQTITYLKDKVRFSEPLSRKQVIRHRVAELASRLEAAKQFTYNVCAGFEKEEQVDQEIIMLKIYCYETSQDIIKECVHLFGAEAFMQNHWLARIYKDSQAFTLAAGTSEVMRDLLAGMMRL